MPPDIRERNRRVDAAAREGWSNGLRRRLANARFRTFCAQKKAARMEGGLREWEGNRLADIGADTCAPRVQLILDRLERFALVCNVL